MSFRRIVDTLDIIRTALTLIGFAVIVVALGAGAVWWIFFLWKINPILAMALIGMWVLLVCGSECAEHKVIQGDINESKSNEAPPPQERDSSML
jgi:hypothetical protein